MVKDGNNGCKGGKDKRHRATVLSKRNEHRPPTKASKAILKLEMPPTCERTSEGYEEGYGGSRASDRTNKESTIRFEEGHGTS